MKNTYLISIGFLLLGLFIGYFLFGAERSNNSNMGGHMMPSGSMMEGDSTMDEMMGGMMAELEGKTGDAFDKAFIEEMVVHHEGAVAMAKSALINSKRIEIKTLASAIVSAQNKEIREMKAWYKSWYGTDLPR